MVTLQEIKNSHQFLQQLSNQNPSQEQSSSLQQQQQTYKFLIFQGNNSKLIRQALVERGNWEEIQDESQLYYINQQLNFVWKPGHFKWKHIELFEEIAKNQLAALFINHFHKNSSLCHKTGLIKSLKKYYRQQQIALKKYHVFNTIPTTFVISVGYEDSEYLNFIEKHKQFQNKQFFKDNMPDKHCQENIWLIKPEALNQGRGIELVKSLKEVHAYLSQQKIDSRWIIQKYIEKPMLYRNRKFDIRMWVLVSPRLEIFLYRHGYLRTSSFIYNTNDNNNYVHLTNNCLQQLGDQYGRYEEGNTIGFENFQKYLDTESQYKDLKVDIERDFMPRIRDLVIDTLLATKKELNSDHKKHCFELFGYDFIIDEDLRIWLLEVNNNPYLGIPNKFIENLLPKMITDMLNIIIDPFLPPLQKFLESQYRTRENGFEIIYSRSPSPFSEYKQINMRRNFNITSNLYPFHCLEQVKQTPQSYYQQQQQSLQQNNNNNQQQLQVVKQQKNQNQQLPQINLQSQQIDYDFKTNFSMAKKNHYYDNLNSTIAINTSFVETNDYNLTQFKMQNKQQLQQINQNYTSNQDNLLNIKLINCQLFQSLKQTFDNYPYQDFDPFYSQVNRIIKKLMNWTKLSNQELEGLCNSLKLIRETRLLPILVEKNYFSMFLIIIENNFCPDVIKVASLQTIEYICKQTGLKKKILSDKFLIQLYKIVIQSCFYRKREESSDYSQQTVKQVCNKILESSSRLQTMSTINDEQSGQRDKEENGILLQTERIEKDNISFQQHQSQLDACSSWVIEAALKTLIQIGGMFDRKIYLPGESRDNEKIRQYFIERGGPAMLLLIQKKSLLEQIKNNMCLQEFFSHMTMTDWEAQAQLLIDLKIQLDSYTSRNIINNRPKNISLKYIKNQQIIQPMSCKNDTLRKNNFLQSQSALFEEKNVRISSLDSSIDKIALNSADKINLQPIVINFRQRSIKKQQEFSNQNKEAEILNFFYSYQEFFDFAYLNSEITKIIAGLRQNMYARVKQYNQKDQNNQKPPLTQNISIFSNFLRKGQKTQRYNLQKNQSYSVNEKQNQYSSESNQRISNSPNPITQQIKQDEGKLPLIPTNKQNQQTLQKINQNSLIKFLPAHIGQKNNLNIQTIKQCEQISCLEIIEENKSIQNFSQS